MRDVKKLQLRRCQYLTMRVYYRHLRQAIKFALVDYRKRKLSKDKLVANLATFAQAFNNMVDDTPWRFSLTIGEGAVKLEASHSHESGVPFSEVFHFSS